mgnify:CR=1 FL=1
MDSRNLCGIKGQILLLCHLNGNRNKIRQMLMAAKSDFARVKKKQRVLDLCTGSGVIPILLAAKTEGDYFSGLELQEGYADMASRSVQMNGLEEKL